MARFIDKFDAIIRSACPLIWIKSYEYDRVIQDILRYMYKNFENFSIYVHSCLGLNNVRIVGDTTIEDLVQGTADIMNALRYVLSKEKSIFIFKNFDLCLQDYRRHSFIEYLYQIYQSGTYRHIYFINISGGPVPPEMAYYFISLDYPLPKEDEIEVIIKNFVDTIGEKAPKNLNQIVAYCKGLSKAEIENTLSISYALYEEANLDLIKQEKANIVKKTGLIEWIEDVPSITEIGGLDNLKAWFTKIAFAYKNWDKAKKYGLKLPKGCLLTGIPGTGKTLSAKAIASLLEVPLFRLDISRVYNSLLGETERNLRIALQTIDAVSPCVVLIDEVEKALAGFQSSGFSDSGVTARIFGNLLYYFQEKKSKSFFVCTANDISLLPPEFLRKGRFDAIWYVGLPNQIERYYIWKIHIEKTGRQFSDNDLKTLSLNSEGYTGAEIESIINETLYETFYERREPRLEDFLSTLKKTTPLSKLESEKIALLEKWAQTSQIKKANSETTGLGKQGLGKHRKILN